MKEAVIVSGARTAVGRAPRGSLRTARPDDMAGAAIAEALRRADGLDPALISEAQETLAFGIQTWPHALVRAMLAEQVYRAATILAGSPYHRD